MAEEYKKQAFRNRCIQRIDELLRRVPNPTGKTAAELEIQIFSRSKSKEDYQAFFDRIIAALQSQANSSSQNNPHLSAMLTSQSASQANLAANQTNNQQMTQQGGQMVGQMPSSMGQGTSLAANQQMTNQGQILSHTGQGIGSMTSMGQSMGMGAVAVNQQSMGPGTMGTGASGGVGQQNQMGQGQIGNMGRMGPGNQMIGQIGLANQGMGMGGGQVMNAGNMMGGHGPNMVPSRMASGMGMTVQGTGDLGWQSTTAHMGMGGLKPGIGSMSGPMGGAKIGGPMQMPLGGQGVGGHLTVGMGRGSVSVSGGGLQQTSIPSPGYTCATGGGNMAVRQNLPNSNMPIPSPGMSQPGSQQSQMIPCQQSPASFIAPSPSATMVPSPMSSGGRGSTLSGAPSPSSGMVDIAAQPTQPQPSPVAAAPAISPLEEKAFNDKIQYLQKYVEPLRKLVANEGEEGASKLKGLLELLTNRSPRVPFKTLERCEKVLEKMELCKESAVEVFMEGVRAALNAPNSSVVFHRTLYPAVNKLTGCSITLPPSPKKKKIDDSSKENLTNSSACSSLTEISYIIQGEIARLPPRFKVNLDNQHIPESDNFALVCHLDDANLPCLPPLTIIVPEKYPESPPILKLPWAEYNSTSFLRTVQSIFARRQRLLPAYSSITQLLDTWEMSVRLAASQSAPNGPNAALASSVSSLSSMLELMSE